MGKIIGFARSIDLATGGSLSCFVTQVVGDEHQVIVSP
jgi:hypothetical protein